MAGRPMGRLHQDDVRAKIQTSQLVNRLTDHALGTVELSPTQVRAIEILIKKTLPDLSAVDLSASDGTLAEAAAYAWQTPQPSPR
jgi:hypothetical protein